MIFTYYIRVNKKNFYNFFLFDTTLLLITCFLLSLISTLLKYNKKTQILKTFGSMAKGLKQQSHKLCTMSSNLIGSNNFITNIN